MNTYLTLKRKSCRIEADVREWLGVRLGSEEFLSDSLLLFIKGSLFTFSTSSTSIADLFLSNQDNSYFNFSVNFIFSIHQNLLQMCHDDFMLEYCDSQCFLFVESRNVINVYHYPLRHGILKLNSKYTLFFHWELLKHLYHQTK